MNEQSPNPYLWDTQCPDCGKWFTKNGLAMHKIKSHSTTAAKTREEKSIQKLIGEDLFRKLREKATAEEKTTQQAFGEVIALGLSK